MWAAIKGDTDKNHEVIVEKLKSALKEWRIWFSDIHENNFWNLKKLFNSLSDHQNL